MVELAREDRWEEALGPLMAQRVFMSLLIVRDLEADNDACNLLGHTFRATTSDNLNCVIVHRHSAFDM